MSETTMVLKPTPSFSLHKNSITTRRPLAFHGNVEAEPQSAHRHKRIQAVLRARVLRAPRPKVAMTTRAAGSGTSSLGPVTMVPVGGGGGQLAAVKVSSPEAEATGGLPIVFGHGLTRNKEHQAKYCQDILNDRVVILYDARGHGESAGWEEQPPEAFTWEAQRGDALAVADAFGLTGPIVLGGNSMTSAATVYAALGEHAARIAGIVFCRLPTAWEARESRREALFAAATSGKGHTPSNALAGAALSDLPRPAAMEGRLPAVPTLLLSTHDDPAHPVATPKAMAELLPCAELVICEHGKKSIKNEFPGIIRDFLLRLDAP
eukprot:jgi/Tetstr1/427555/TSEL_017681.t1